MRVRKISILQICEGLHICECQEDKQLRVIKKVVALLKIGPETLRFDLNDFKY